MWQYGFLDHLKTQFFKKAHLPTDAEGKEMIRQVIEGEDRSDGQIYRALERISAAGALKQSLVEAERFIAEAKASLAGLPAIPARRSLTELADFVVQRDY